MVSGKLNWCLRTTCNWQGYVGQFKVATRISHVRGSIATQSSSRWSLDKQPYIIAKLSGSKVGFDYRTVWLSPGLHGRDHIVWPLGYLHQQFHQGGGDKSSPRAHVSTTSVSPAKSWDIGKRRKNPNYVYRKDAWNSSEVFYKPQDHEDATFGVDKNTRNSSSAFVPHEDLVARCLLKRTKQLLGNAQHENVETPQLVRYTGGERFRPHMDTIEPTKATNFHPDYTERPWNRLLSAFVYLNDNCTGGETYFPRLTGVGADADGSKFSRAANRQGLLVKPKRGNAIVWKNLFNNGSVDERLVHASLAIRSGEKVGMNLFTWHYFDSPMVGDASWKDLKLENFPSLAVLGFLK